MSILDELRKLGEELRATAEPGDIFHKDTKWSAKESGEGWAGEVYGFFPTQGKGTVDGLNWYYRSRGGEWRFAVAYDAEADAADVGWDDGPSGWITGNEDADEPDHVADAWRRIREAIKTFRETREP